MPDPITPLPADPAPPSPAPAVDPAPSPSPASGPAPLAADPSPNAPLPAGDGVAQPAPLAVDYSQLATPEHMRDDMPVLEAVKAIAAEHKLPLEATQAVLAMLDDQVATALRAHVDGTAAEQKAWLAELNADPDIGAAGLARRNEILKSHATAELREWLTETGLINQPQLVRFLASVGKDLGESQMLRSGRDTPTDNLKSIYNKSPQMWQ